MDRLFRSFLANSGAVEGDGCESERGIGCGRAGIYKHNVGSFVSSTLLSRQPFKYLGAILDRSEV